MRIISKRRLREFWQQQAAARSPLEGWYRVVNDKQLAWADFHDVKATYASASLVGECVVFNVGGNKIRLITKINYFTHTIFIRAILTHELRWTPIVGQQLGLIKSWFWGFAARETPSKVSRGRVANPRVALCYALLM